MKSIDLNDFKECILNDRINCLDNHIKWVLEILKDASVYFMNVLLHRCADLICCGWRSSRPHFKSQPSKTKRDPRLQIAHWHSGPYNSLLLRLELSVTARCTYLMRDPMFTIFEQGIEDYLGDMDFKLAGTNKGITALQVKCFNALEGKCWI